MQVRRKPKAYIRLCEYARTSIVASAAISLALVGSTASQAFQLVELPLRVDWTLYSANSNECCVPPPASGAVACGNYGTFFFGADPGGSVDCLVKAGGSDPSPIGYNLPKHQADQNFFALEVPIEWPRKAGSQQIGNGDDGQGDHGQGSDSDQEQPPSPPVRPPGSPCHDFSCLSPAGGEDGQQPWMMILDWQEEPLAKHGMMVAAIASQMFHEPVTLFGVDRPETVTLLGAGISDAHLIYNLCEVIEEVDAGTLRAPTSLNMSLGRHHQEGEATDLSCDSNTLNCQLAQVIQQLRHKGTIPFAAAGNYRQKEFPGILEHVVEVGNLDMARFQASQASEPTWETPPDTQLLMPGYGMCIEYPDHGQRLLYATPGGTSFSSINAASMISRAMLDYDLADPTGLSWAPEWREHPESHGGCFVFGDFSPPNCNPVLDRMIKRMTNFPVPTCWSPEISASVLDLDMPAVPPQRKLTLDKPGLSECLANHLPAPTNDICIPCGMGQSESKSAPLGKYIDRPMDAANDLILDLSGSAPEQSSSATRPTSMYLRIGSEFHLLLGPDNPQEIADLSDARYQNLVVRNAISYVPADIQPSLVTFYAQPGANDLGCWHASPILLMGR